MKKLFSFACMAMAIAAVMSSCQPEVKVNSLTIAEKLNVEVGKTATIKATVDPADAVITWKSSDESIVTVADGVVTGVAVGTANVTASAGDLQKVCKVTVEEAGVIVVEAPVTALDDFTEDEGWWQATVETEDYVFNLCFNSDHLAGTYTTAEMDGQYTWGMDSESSFNFTSCEGTVTVNGEIVNLDFRAVADNDLKFHLILSYDPNGPLQYDVTDADFNANFTWGDMQLDTQYLTDYGVLNLVATNANNETVVLQFFVANTVDDALMIPDGTYPINRSGAAPSVTASEGVSGSSVSASFAGTRDAEGYIDEVWFMVEGNVTVARSGSNATLTVNATNSANRTINATISGATRPSAPARANANQFRSAKRMNVRVR